MKKLLLATAVAALSVSAAQAAPTVYGKAFLTADYQSTSSDVTNPVQYTVDNATGNIVGTPVAGQSYSVDSSDTTLNSNGSRIGLKGAEALTANTDLLYQLEYGINVDDSTKAQFKSRDTYLGLANKQYGTFLAGRLTPIDDAVNYANVTVGGVLGGDDVLVGSLDRANNAFAYVSPSYNGATLMAMYGLDSDQDANSLVDHEQVGVGVKYEPAGQPFRAGATYITAGDALKTTRVSGAYDINPMMTVGALYQLTDYNTDDNENGFALSGEMKTASPWTVYAQGDLVQNAKGYKDDEASRVVLGGKYAFNKATTGHVYGAYMNSTLNGEPLAAPVKTATTTTYYGAEKIESDGFGIGAGIEYKF